MGWSDLDPDRIKNLPDYVKNTLPFILTRMGGVTSIMQQLTLNMVPEGMGVQTVANAFNKHSKFILKLSTSWRSLRKHSSWR